MTQTPHHANATFEVDHDTILHNLQHLANMIARCSVSTFYELRTEMKEDCISFGRVLHFPDELFTCSDLKAVMTQRLGRSTGWNFKTRAAVLRLLVSFSSPLLFSQIGALAQVCNITYFLQHRPLRLQHPTHGHHFGVSLPVQYCLGLQLVSCYFRAS